MIDIKLFKFDAATDYLPYYINYSLEYNTEDTVHDVLNKMNEIEKFSYVSESECFLRINNLFISSDTKISEFVQNKSAEITIEPISILRAKSDLLIDTQDYKEKLHILSNYLTDEEIATVIEQKKYMLEYYASTTLAFNQDFIGEHVLLLASELISKEPTNAKEILLLLKDKNNGIENRTSLKYRLLNSQKEEIQKPSIDFEIQQYFENFNIALYCGLSNSASEGYITQTKAEYVELNSKHFGIPTQNANQKMNNAIAGHILLEAKDNNADFLLIDDNAMLSLFDAKQKQIEKVVGREIDMPIVTKSQFLKLMQGERDKTSLGLASHKINVPFLD